MAGTKPINPRKVFEKLIDKAMFRNIVGSPDYMVLQQCLKEGKPIPEKCLPGRLLDSLTDEEREVLKELTSDMVGNYRVDW